MTIFPKHLGESWPFGSPGYAYGCTVCFNWMTSYWCCVEFLHIINILKFSSDSKKWECYKHVCCMYQQLQVNPAQVTSKHKLNCCPVLAQNGRICLFASTGLTVRFRRAREFLYNLASLLEHIRAAKTTCWFWKIFYMMKNKRNFPNKNVGSALNKRTKK